MFSDEELKELQIIAKGFRFLLEQEHALQNRYGSFREIPASGSDKLIISNVTHVNMYSANGLYQVHKLAVTLAQLAQEQRDAFQRKLAYLTNKKDVLVNIRYDKALLTEPDEVLAYRKKQTEEAIRQVNTFLGTTELLFPIYEAEQKLYISVPDLGRACLAGGFPTLSKKTTFNYFYVPFLKWWRKLEEAQRKATILRVFRSTSNREELEITLMINQVLQRESGDELFRQITLAYSNLGD